MHAMLWYVSPCRQLQQYGSCPAFLCTGRVAHLLPNSAFIALNYQLQVSHSMRVTALISLVAG